MLRSLGMGWSCRVQMMACRIEINQLLFADDTTLVADSEKLRRLVSEFGRVRERRKSRVNVHAVGKSKVIRCSRYGNLG